MFAGIWDFLCNLPQWLKGAGSVAVAIAAIIGPVQWAMNAHNDARYTSKTSFENLQKELREDAILRRERDDRILETVTSVKKGMENVQEDLNILKSAAITGRFPTSSSSSYSQPNPLPDSTPESKPNNAGNPNG